ncbi:MAG TPA: GDSL family lipase [Opitutae bacterium]|nr:GDSL family lipase [Puniceicoccaceae bacterium]HBR92689.1 GDSL family lipase [Opitutae bacterium]|tara:strand:+ start:626 stop:1279 length:654 start_codon:yes stop_codon:yes gene_type:complete
MIIPAQSKLLFIGDSITDAGRADSGETTPWDVHLGLGKGYVNLVNAILTAGDPELKLRVINRGVSGNTVLDMAARWQTDVLDLKPDWLSVMIGINDVWRQFDVPRRSEAHISPETYQRTYHDLLQQVRPQLQGLVLMTPYVFEANRSDAMRARMDEYGSLVRQLAGDFDALFVDTQAAVDRVLQHMHPTALAWDRIHPGAEGHMIFARAFLEAVDFT